MPEIMLRSFVDGAVWLGVGVTILLLAQLALSAWLYYRTQQPEPAQTRYAPGVARTAPAAASPKLEDPAIQARIQALQLQFRRGEIDQAAYEAELAKIRRDLAA